MSRPRGAPASRRRARADATDGAAAPGGGDQGATAQAPVAARRTSGATKNGVLAALSTGSAMTASDVAAATGVGRASVSTTLSKLAKSGEVTKAGRGYQLASAQPSASTLQSPDGDGRVARTASAAPRRRPRPSQATGAEAELAAEPRARRRRSEELSADRVAAILAERDEEGLSAVSLAEQLGASNRRVLAVLGELEAAGRARREGSRRTSRWIATTDEERIAARAAELEAGSNAQAPIQTEPPTVGGTAASADRDDGQSQAKAPELT